MSTELEAKFKLDSHDVLRDALRACGAQHLSTVIEENHILDRNDGALHHAGCALRVRGCDTCAGTPKPDTLTYKGAKMKSRFKSRPEYEVHVSSARETLTILQNCGFAVTLSFQKKRESWRLDDCLVELDELPILGLFVEIEGPSESAIQTAQDKLGLGDLAHVHRGYVGMLADYCRDQNVSDRVIRFQCSQGPLT